MEAAGNLTGYATKVARVVRAQKAFDAARAELVEALADARADEQVRTASMACPLRHEHGFHTWELTAAGTTYHYYCDGTGQDELDWQQLNQAFDEDAR